MTTRHPLTLIADALALLTRERTELVGKALLGGLSADEARHLCALEELAALGHAVLKIRKEKRRDRSPRLQGKC